jgi:hypothetical protein
LQFGCSIAVLFKRGKQARETLYSYRKINWHLAKSFCPGSKILVIGDRDADETDKTHRDKKYGLNPKLPFFRRKPTRKVNSKDGPSFTVRGVIICFEPAMVPHQPTSIMPGHMGFSKVPVSPIHIV